LSSDRYSSASCLADRIISSRFLVCSATVILSSLFFGRTSPSFGKQVFPKSPNCVSLNQPVTCWRWRSPDSRNLPSQCQSGTPACSAALLCRNSINQGQQRQCPSSTRPRPQRPWRQFQIVTVRGRIVRCPPQTVIGSNGATNPSLSVSSTTIYHEVNVFGLALRRPWAARVLISRLVCILGRPWVPRISVPERQCLDPTISDVLAVFRRSRSRLVSLKSAVGLTWQRIRNDAFVHQVGQCLAKRPAHRAVANCRGHP